MRNKQSYSIIVARESDGFVSICPELDIASQGESREEAKNNLNVAIALFLETASALEIRKRYGKK
jgi:predicted RNase H-like HicB family nuclease